MAVKIIIPATHGMMEMAANAAATLQVFDRDAEICVLETGSDVIDRTYNPFGTLEFHVITLRKLELVLARLRNGETVFLIDADIVVRRDPLPYLQAIDADLVIQNDAGQLHRPGGLLCTGFFLARPTRQVVTLFENAVALMEGGTVNDQDAVNACINDGHDVSLHLLDQRLFPNGYIWRGYRPNEAYIVHANHIRGQAGKVRILKRTGLYGGGSTRPLRLIYRNLWRAIGATEYVLTARRYR